jgi:hypothetical protein
MRRFTLDWGEVDVFTAEPVPEPLMPTATLAARLGSRFRPAWLRLSVLRGSAPYMAVWPHAVPLPSGDGGEPLTAEDMAGVVLAETFIHTCFVCAARFQVIYPETGLPFFSAQLSAHKTISGCPSCGSDFSRSRIQGLVLLPWPLTDA